jgi:hypothetical protein
MAMMVISFHGGFASTPSTINTLATFQLGGPLPGLRELRGFIVGLDGHLYLVNGYKDNSLVLQFTSPAAGSPVTFLMNFVTDHLSHPFDLAFGPDGHLYVSNQDSNEVTRYEGPGDKHPGSYKGTFLSGFSVLRGLACDGNYWYIADEKGGTNKTGAVLGYDLTGKPAGSVAVADPVHLLSSGGYIYVGSGSGNQVLAFKGGDFTDAPTTVVGSALTPAINATAGLAIPGDGFLYVASRKGQQVLRYPLTPPTTATNGSVFLDALPDQPEFIGML